MEFVIIVIVVLILVVGIIANSKIKSQILGSQIKTNGSVIVENLMILTPTIVPFQNGVSTMFIIYEKGIMVIQDNYSIEIPWDGIEEMEAINQSSISTEGGSILGRAAIGGVLGGDIGAIIGGLSAFQQNSVIKGHLFYLCFNYADYGLTTFAIYVGAEIFDFMNTINQYRSK